MRPLSALVVALAAVLLAPGAALADPAEAALATRDAYVSPRALGSAAAEAEATLEETARRLAESERDVKIAIVAGPVGAPSMRTYVRGLRTSLGYRGTLVVTAPDRPAFAEGPLAPATITVRLRAGMVGAIADPVERAVTAAELAAPPGVEPPPGSGVRQIGALIGLALLGGGWAVAWGLRREQRAAREALVEAREGTRVLMDALGARVRALDTADGGLPAGALAALSHARSLHDGAQTALAGAGSAGEADLVRTSVADGFAALIEAESAAGRPCHADPFAGLCALDPAHGPATGEATPADAADSVPACDACRRAAAEGDPPTRRLVPAGRRAVPFDEAGLTLPPRVGRQGAPSGAERTPR